jgi:uncharacterized protein (TIGR03435 family)
MKLATFRSGAIILLGSAAMLLATWLACGAQDQASTGASVPKPLSFEVASLKPSQAQMGRRRIESEGGRYMAEGITLKMLIQQAFDVKDFQIIGAPGWATSDQFDINAKAENPDMNSEQLRERLRSLLRERFNLKIKKETRELQIYVLVEGKGGHKLHSSQTQPLKQDTPPDAMIRIGRRELAAEAASISDLTNMLAQKLGRPVTDKTGIKGLFDFKLQFTPDEIRGVETDPAADTSAPSIFTAVREQLGLKLENQKGPVEVLVIISVEKPSRD